MKTKIFLFCFFPFLLITSSYSQNSMSSTNRKQKVITISLPELIPYRKGDLWGYCDKNKKIVIPIIYSEVKPFKEKFAAVNKNGLWGFINEKGEKICPYKYNYVESFNDERALVGLNGKYGFIDYSGKVIIPIQYQDALSFENGFALVALVGGLKGYEQEPQPWDKKGAIDKNGRVIIPCDWTWIGINWYHNSILIQQGNCEDYLYDFKGKFIGKKTCTNKNLEVQDGYSEGLAVIRKDNKYGFINIDGEIAVPIIYSNVEAFKDGLALVSKDGKSGFVNNNGELIIPLKYDYARSFSDGFAIVGKKKESDKNDFNVTYTYSIIDRKGKEISLPNYAQLWDFSNGLALVFQGKIMHAETTWYDGKYGYIDTDGKLVIPIKYKEGEPFSDGLALVHIDKNSFYIDIDGTEYFN